MKKFRERLKLLSEIPALIAHDWENVCEFFSEPRPPRWLSRAVEHVIPDQLPPIRWWRLLIFLAFLSIFGGAVHVAHGRQRTRLASSLLSHAEQYEQQQNAAQAAQFLRMYLSIESQDTDALARLAILLADGAASVGVKSEAATLCDRVLAQDSSRTDMRRRAVRLWLECGRFAQAARHAEALCEATPDDADVWHQLGLARLGLSEFADSATAFEHAIELGSNSIGLSTALAAIYRDKLNQLERADELMDAMVQANDDEPEAYAARFRHRTLTGRAVEASADIERALELAPENAAFLWDAADWSFQQRDLARAIAYAQRGAAARPGDARFCLLRAKIHRLRDELDRAEECLRAGAERQPNDQELLVCLAEVLIDRGVLDDGQRVLDRLGKLARDSIPAKYLEARLWLAKGEPIRAAACFERALPRFIATPALAAEAHFFLGECYRLLLQPDLALAAYRQSMQLAPDVSRTRLAAARTLAQLGQFREAMLECDALMREPVFPIATAAVWARAYLAAELRRPTDERSWVRLEEMLKKCETVQPQPSEMFLVRAEYAAVRGERDEAAAILEAAVAEHPGDLALRLALATARHRAGHSAEVEPVFEAAQRELGDNVELRVARAGHLAATGRAETAATLLKEGPEQAQSDRERMLLCQALPDFSVARRDAKDARRYFADAVNFNSMDFRLQLAAVESAFTDADFAAIDRALEKLRELSGPLETVAQYVEARRAVLAARDGDRSRLERARQLLAAVCDRRPTWSLPVVQLGRVAEALGRTNDAIDAYTRAQALGNGDPELGERLVRLLAAAGRHTEARVVLDRLDAATQLAPELERYSAELAAQTGDWGRAVAAARRSVASAPDDFRGHLLLGNLLQRSGQPEQAEAAFRGAVALAPHAAETWADLIGFLGSSGRPDAARQAIDEAAEKIDADDAVAALPQFFELAGLADAADERFRAALGAHPNDLNLLTAAADFLMRRGHLAPAEQCLRRILSLRPDSPNARRGLALVVADQRAYANWEEARGLLERNFEQSPTPLDRRAKAILLAMRPNAQHVVEAVQLLEEIAALGLNRTAEQLLLADLYYLAGSRELGRATLRGVLNGPTTASADAVTAISALITQHELSEADVWLTALARREPRHIGLLAQRARWLDGLRRSDEAVALLRNVLEVESAGVSADERRHLVVGTLDMMQWTEAAEQLYREATECGASVTDFAMWLGRRGRLDAALAAVRPLAERGEFASAAIAGAGVLVRADPSAEQIALVAEWQSRAAAQSETNMTKFGLALLRHAQGRHDDAADILRQLAATGMNPSVVLNDLAWIVGVELDRPAEALEHINEAIKQSGPEPHLLDTRGVVLTRLGRFADAIADLTESANAQPGINAGRYLNLARAYSLIGDADQARSALRKIDSARPGAGLVRAAQQAEFAALRAQLEK